ncbi:MAG: N-formylglutamate amidohydrolase [Tatlockia sp.]|nr:N-formylglutamate amidohydrolase [Tatlockia sp.]
MKKIALVISCEHAVNTVPEEYQSLFEPHHQLLKTHRGIDFGSKAIATAFYRTFNCDFVQAKATRLLIDCNRSLHHRSCFSEITKGLSREEKEKIVRQYYLPFREEVETSIKKLIKKGMRVLHLSIHSFTPTLDEVERNVDVGFLYDPKRALEKKLAKLWQQEMKMLNNHLRLRLNSPYRGITDGFPTALRKKYAEADYIGIEIESNQKLIADPIFLDYLSEFLPQSLRKTLNQQEAD